MKLRQTRELLGRLPSLLILASLLILQFTSIPRWSKKRFSKKFSDRISSRERRSRLQWFTLDLMTSNHWLPLNLHWNSIESNEIQWNPVEPANWNRSKPIGKSLKIESSLARMWTGKTCETGADKFRLSRSACRGIPLCRFVAILNRNDVHPMVDVEHH